MKITIPTTEFAPAERVPIAIVRRQAGAVTSIPGTGALLNSVLNYVFILNAQRQIVFASQNCQDLQPGTTQEQLLGTRPGEALGCIHAQEHEAGCGTTVFCQECGAVQAILASLAGRRETREYHLTRVVNCREEAMDLLVCGSPFPVRNETYSLLAVMDIGHEKRRRALERIFFHDILNSAGGLETLAGMINESVPDPMQQDMQLLQDGLHDLNDQIQNQRDLTAAECRELTVNPAPLNPGSLLQGVVRLYQKDLAARDRRLCLAPDPVTTELISDATLLRRVLGNLIKNALEAARPGQTVTAGCEEVDDGVRFWVYNPVPMPKAVQLQVFSRSFSTKGLGRGLGTYSAKLLTEQCLHGQIGFSSNPETGTTFFAIIPQRRCDPLP